MKTISKNILAALSACILVSCNKEQIEYRSNTSDTEIATRTDVRRFHWKCPTCKLINGGWRSQCTCAAGTKYSPDMADLVIQMWLMDKTVISTITVPSNWGGGEPAPGSIQLTDDTFTATAPPEWYETTTAQKYYNQYMNSILITETYKEAFNYAWYKVTHILYPGKHKISLVESEYDKWMLRQGRNLSGDKGQGLKDGSKAAVKAFADR